MADGLRERYEWKGFKIYFGKKDDYGSVIAGATVLKSCRHESLEKVKRRCVSSWKIPKISEM